MKRIFILLIFIPLISYGQFVRLTKYQAKSVLYLDLDRLYNYNLYERNQLGLGLYFVSPTNNAQVPQWRLSAYCGYSTLPQEWKYGGKVTLCYPKGWKWQPYLQYFEDFMPAASTSLENYSLLNPNMNTGFMTSHLMRVRRAAIGTSFTPNHGILDFRIDLRYDREWLRFEGDRLLYPVLQPEDYRSFQDFATLHLLTSYKGRLLFDLSYTSPINDFTSRHSLRAILQYSRTYKYKNSILNTFYQGGIITPDAPLQHRFDISGTAGSHYFFSNALLTIAPNSFIADYYVRFTTKWRIEHLIALNKFFNPKPFIQLSGAAAKQYNGVWTALLEPCVGIDDLLRFGLLNLGGAFAYKMAPHEAACYSPIFKENYALMITATLSL